MRAGSSEGRMRTPQDNYSRERIPTMHRLTTLLATMATMAALAVLVAPAAQAKQVSVPANLMVVTWTQIPGHVGEDAYIITGKHFRFEAHVGTSEGPVAKHADFQCRIDGSEWSSCKSPHVFAIPRDGERHLVQVRTTDGTTVSDPVGAQVRME
jgi:hypothetical protein